MGAFKRLKNRLIPHTPYSSSPEDLVYTSIFLSKSSFGKVCCSSQILKQAAPDYQDIMIYLQATSELHQWAPLPAGIKWEGEFL